MERIPLETLRWMRSQPMGASFATEQIDVENGIIRDVLMVQEGPAKGHGVSLEAEFIADLVAYDLRVFKVRGVKARLGHPGTSDNTMGMQLGFFTNVRTREVKGKMQAIADLHILRSANQSPTKPQMGDWVMSMAQEAPDFIMSSIVFAPGPLYQRDSEGKKKYVPIVTDPDGYKYYNQDNALGDVYVEFGKKGEHYFTDLVEDGAATDSLFSTTANPHFFVSQATTWFDEHPAIKKFAQDNPEKVHAFIAALGITPQKKNMSLKKLLFGNEQDDATNLSADDVKELRDKITQADAALSSANQNLADATAALAAANASLATKETELTAAQARIAELEKKAAAVHTDGDTGDQGEAVKSYHKTPINLRAQKIGAGRVRTENA